MAVNRRNHVPAWYHLEEALISNPLTRPFLFTWHRARKKYGTIREKRLARKYPQCLMNFERKVYSQNGEDGIIQEIFNRIGTTDKFFVEFGIQDGTECCCRNLLEHHGWSGVWMEGSAELAERARQRFGHLPIKVLHRFVTTDNIVASFQEAGIPREFDFLSIDVDGNDYWIWKQIGPHYSPRVIIVESQRHVLAPPSTWIYALRPEPCSRQHRLFREPGMEPGALLGKEFGYSLGRV